ncbi:hypothetical protein AVEN_112209-1 [Araneus ventricosus]|uniref:DUF5641 domain-containing protein n=1 Tax=Araneus ventricosus TaxID=182803 RepID=A0A4Y2SIV0_ARAVE|nr:hypothetical protein AVEN_112209-1 [Araneus ventricosus]
MVTLLCECESVVTGRPLTYLYDDPNELRAIKPSDFIQDIKVNEAADLDIVDAKHLRSDNTKSLNRPLGRVIELFQGKDNIGRVAKLRVVSGEIIRPIQKISLLEMSSTEISKGVPENIESVAEITYNANRLHTVSNEHSSQAYERTIADCKENTL